MPSQRGSLISGQTDPPYRFQPIDQRARSASGYVDDYYVEQDERSFICSKPGFVCAAAVVFTVSFIALAFFIESGMEWPPKVTANSTDDRVAGASINRFRSNKDTTADALPKVPVKEADGKAVEANGIGQRITNNVNGPPLDRSTEEPGLTNNARYPEAEDVKEQPRRPSNIDKLSGRKIPDLPEKQPPKDTLFVYAPFDDSSSKQKRVLRFLMDAQRFTPNSSLCFPDFTFGEVAKFLEVDGSSESEEENTHSCANLDGTGFLSLKDHFKNDLKRNSKYLFVVRDPRSLIHQAFNKHGSELENCKDNISRRCLYNEEIMNNARKTVENWNTTTAQMIEVCKKLKRSTCRMILFERLILRQTDTLDEIAKFLVMDENRDVYRMLQSMMQKVDEGNVNARTEKQRDMVDLLASLLTDTSNTWPWSGQLPFNVFEGLPQWAPLMGKIGYGFTAEVPDMSKDWLDEYIQSPNTR